LGCTPIRLLADTAGFIKATELYGARFFGSSARPDGFLSTDVPLSKEARARLKKSWEDAYQGENQHKMAILEEGMKFEAMSMPNDHAQFLETRKFQRSEIPGWFP